ncbi:HAD family hydrolase [Ornithinibacillus sp. FSL M8-0202]|uniref:HAD family hydrolase n=1 Tax=Ornithinibacillus sp. FSL M8-0202 TaxID=2921616 RepID=UPI0030D629C9
MTYQVLFLDIDGTILKPDHTYHPKTKEAIAQVQELGMEVFLATGRPSHELSELAADLNIESFIGYNGAYAMYKGKNILDAPMDPTIVKRYLAIAEEHGHDIIFYSSEDNFVTSSDSPPLKKFAEMFALSNLKRMNEDIIEHILGATLINVAPEEVSLYEIDDDIRLSQVNVNGAEHCFDVIRKSVNKGEAVKIALEHLTISAEAAIAFGDGMNDKEMLETVGASFAMGNANPELFQYAKFKTKTVADAGVFYGLKELGLVK